MRKKVRDSDVVSNKETHTLIDKHRSRELNKTSDVGVILDEFRVKDRLEEKAFRALDRRLEPRNVMCKSCKGEGYKGNGDNCGMCQGQGFVLQDADMRAIELVLSPKFPKTQVNVNADIDGMTTESLLDMIESM